MPTDILMPALSPTMEEGKLAKWLVKEGDEVSSGDIIAEIETDKATMEVEAVDEGTVAAIKVAEGTEGVKVNTVIAVLAADGEDARCGGNRFRQRCCAGHGRGGREPVRGHRGCAGKGAGATCSAGVVGSRVDLCRPGIPEGTEMVETTVREALNSAMAEEMRSDETSS
jgi:pyruvate dehydrogenase E1 component beta subunit